MLGSLCYKFRFAPARLCPRRLLCPRPPLPLPVLQAPRGQRPAQAHPCSLHSAFALRLCHAELLRHRNRRAWPWLWNLRGRLVAHGLQVALREPTEDKAPGPGAGAGVTCKALFSSSGKGFLVCDFGAKESEAPRMGLSGPQSHGCQTALPSRAWNRSPLLCILADAVYGNVPGMIGQQTRKSPELLGSVRRSGFH